MNAIFRYGLLFVVLLLCACGVEDKNLSTPTKELVQVVALTGPTAESLRPADTQLPPTPTQTSSPTPVPSATPEPMQTATPTFTPTPQTPLVVTLRQAPVYAGPGAPYPELAIYAGGISLPVVASSEDGRWRLVALSRDKTGWISVDLVESVGLPQDLPRVTPDYNLLPTATPTAANVLYVVAWIALEQQENPKRVNLTAYNLTKDTLFTFGLYDPDRELVEKNEYHITSDKPYSTGIKLKGNKSGMYTVVVWNSDTRAIRSGDQRATATVLIQFGK